jgi:hypothetical protein
MVRTRGPVCLSTRTMQGRVPSHLCSCICRWTVPHADTGGVPDDLLATIGQHIASISEASARSGLPAAALEEVGLCLVKASRLGAALDHYVTLLWCLRPREGMLQSTMIRLLAAMSTASFPADLRSMVLRWLLLMLEDEQGESLGWKRGADGPDAGQRAARGGSHCGEVGSAADSLSTLCAMLLRPLYRVLFHMLIASYAPASSSPVSAPAASVSAHSCAADRHLLCEILLKITSRREARPCWLQISLVRLLCRVQACVFMAASSCTMHRRILCGGTSVRCLHASALRC